MRLVSVGESSEDESFDTDDLDELDETKVVEELETVPDFEEDEVLKRLRRLQKMNQKKIQKKPKLVSQENPYYIKINKRMNTVTVYGLDENGNYNVPVKAMVASTGRHHLVSLILK